MRRTQVRILPTIPVICVGCPFVWCMPMMYCRSSSSRSSTRKTTDDVLLLSLLRLPTLCLQEACIHVRNPTTQQTPSAGSLYAELPARASQSSNVYRPLSTSCAHQPW
ncbi:hypothetical protein HDK64DRAFT_146299 [Phyllosticta capitalensis]